MMNRFNYLVSENARCVKEIFYLDMLPRVGKSEILGEATVAQVSYPKFKTYKDFETYIKDLYADDYAEKKLKTDVYEGYPQYFEHNGALYENVSMLGGIGYFIEWNDFRIDNVVPDGEHCKFDVNVIYTEDTPKPYVVNMEAVNENGVWKLVKMFTGE